MSRNRAVQKIIPKLPDYLRPEEGDKIPTDLIGSKIVGFGTINEAHVEGGGLVIDYVPHGGTQCQRLHLAFDELGMWIHRQSTLD